MASRPVFVPKMVGGVGVERRIIEFKWHPGMSTAQKRRSITELHTAAGVAGIKPILEISSKSEVSLGVELSAFNLRVPEALGVGASSVETVFQGSKVFENGGPFTDLFGLDSRAAKRDPRLQASGALVAFELDGVRWPLTPKTGFYDWLYLESLTAKPRFATKVARFRGFTDIEFNPMKSLNCQAASAALYLSLQEHKQLEPALGTPEAFRKIAYPTDTQ